MRGERAGHTLQPTALVHEAFLKLVKARELDWNDRTHFLAVSSRLMRQVLVDHVRRRGYAKRGQGTPNLPLELADPTVPLDLDGVLAVHLALEDLASQDERKAHVVELRFFGGLTVEETAGVLGISAESVNRDWRLAKAWLLRSITEGKARVE
jgi:RNA polymerase sigma factor (TIGR02999 family)